MEELDVVAPWSGVTLVSSTTPFELAHVEIELLARDLQEPGGVALPELALAEIDGRRVIGMNRNPGINHGRVGRASGIAARGQGRRCRIPEMKSDHERTAGLEQIAA